MRFWDSSALVPLVVRQNGSAEVERWLEEDADVVTWTLAEIEILSALHRLVRAGALSEEAARRAESTATELVRAAHVVTDVERVKGLARRLLRVHELRAADALQLAAALAWADGPATGLAFHTFDARLGNAAHREGFRVLGID